MLACGEKEDEIKTHTPIGSVARSVGIVFAADLNADRLLSDLQNLADLKNDWHRPFAVLGGSIPVRRGFRVKGEGRMGLCRVSNEWLDKHLVDIAAVVFNYDRPKLVHQHAYGPRAFLL